MFNDNPVWLGKRQGTNKKGDAPHTVQQIQGGNQKSPPAQSLLTEGQMSHTAKQVKGPGSNQQGLAAHSLHAENDVAARHDEQIAGGIIYYFAWTTLQKQRNSQLKT